MIKKIREYVNYQLRFDHSDDVEEKKEEIIANITDRYEEIFKDTRDRQYAYIEAIKSMGDFTSNSTEIQDSYKPKAAEMFLLTGLILAVFSLLLMMFNPVVGGIVVMLSIVFFSTGAMYLYQESQYVKDNEYDIDKHNAYLKKVFAYMKTCFVFWSISISLLVTILLNSLISSLVVLNTVNNMISFDDLKVILFLSIVIFIVIFIILLIIFRGIYLRLANKYYKMTGEDTIVSIGNRAKDFLDIDGDNKEASKISKVYPVYVLVISILNLVSLVGMIFNLDTYTEVYPLVIGLQFFIVIMNMILSIVVLRGDEYKGINNNYLLPVVFLLSSVILVGLANIQWSAIGPISLFSGTIMLLFLVGELIIYFSKSKK